MFVDNCSVHKQGHNIGMQKTLWSNYNICIITLPPYSPEFNPTKLMFDALLQRLSSVHTRYNKVGEMNFVDAIGQAMNAFDLHDVKAFYNFCGYKY